MPLHRPDDTDFAVDDGKAHDQVIPRVFGDARAEAHARELAELSGGWVDRGKLQRIRVALVIQDQGQPLAPRSGVEQRHDTRALRVVERVDEDVSDYESREADSRAAARGEFGQPG